VSVHGFCGVWGLLAVGIFCAGYPGVGDIPAISFMGQFKGAIVMILLGFIPALVIGYLLRIFGLLRVRNEVELMGLDEAEIPSQSYPEFARWEEATAGDHDRPRRPRPDAPVLRDRAPRSEMDRNDPDRVPPLPPRRQS